MKELKELLLQAPDGQLDASMFPLIEKWDDEPKAIQILEVLDNCIYAGLSSGFVVFVLETMLTAAMKQEGTTLEKVAEDAVWRKERV